MKRQLTVAFGILLLTLGIAGCSVKKPTITNLPPGVDGTQVANWYVATGAMKDVSVTVKGATDFVISLNRAEFLEDGPVYQKLLTSLGKAAQGGLHVTNVLQEHPNTFDQSVRTQIQSHVDIIFTELEQVLDSESVFNVDADKAAKWKNYMTTIRIAIVTVMALLDGALSVDSNVMPMGPIMEVAYV